MRLLALDFDGVISDSAPECFAVAIATYVSMRPSSQYAGQASALYEARSKSDLLARIQGDALYRSLLELMPLGNRAEDFGVALGILDRGVRVDDQADYDREWKFESESFRADFHTGFYDFRDRFRSEQPELWLSLIAPYPDFIRLLRERSSEIQLAIATAKDRASVLELLARYAVADLFSDDCILDKDTGVSKRAHLEALAERTSTALSEIRFVDDKVNHLDGVASLGVGCVLAAWGYNGARERALAKEHGYMVCELDDAGQLFG